MLVETQTTNSTTASYEGAAQHSRNAEPVTVAAAQAIASAERATVTVNSSALWDERLARFEATGARYRQQDDRRRSIQKAADEIAPKPQVLHCFGGIQGILNDRSVGAEEQLRRIGLWEEWEPKHKAAMAAAGWTVADQVQMDSEEDDVCDAFLDAEGELMRTPAPSVEALAIKLRNLMADEVGPLIGDDVDSSRFLSAVLAGENYIERTLASCVQDALRLAGIDDEFSRAAPFSAQPLFDLAAIEGFEVTTNSKRQDQRPKLGLMNVSAHEHAAPSIALSEALRALTPAERRVVCQSVHRRRAETVQ